MNQRLPPDAFAYYVGLGATRSYQAVADRFGVTKTAVVNRASEENWPAKLREVENRIAVAAAKQAEESIVAMNDRHLKSLRVIQGKALEALRSTAIHSAMDAVRALDLAIKEERVIRGEPSERTAVAVEDVIKREYERWMGGTGQEAASGDGLAREAEDVAPPTEEPTPSPSTTDASTAEAVDDEADDAEGEEPRIDG